MAWVLAGVDGEGFASALSFEEVSRRMHLRAHPDLSQGPADLQSAALTTELCTHMYRGRAWHAHAISAPKMRVRRSSLSISRESHDTHRSPLGLMDKALDF